MENLFDEKIGGFGLYQKTILLISIGGISILSSFNVYSTIFIIAKPKLICKSTLDGSSTINDCKLWSSLNNKPNSSLPLEYICEFDKTYYGSTLINDWKLVCEKEFQASLIQTMFLVGTLTALFGGSLGDSYGRKKCCFVYALIMSLILILNQTLQLEQLPLDNQYRYIIFCVAQFFTGFLNNSLYVTAYVLLVEFVSVKYNTLVSNLNLYFYIFGELIVLCIAYFARDWRILSWSKVAYCVFITVCIFFFLPESPRYLLAHNKFDELYNILRKIALMNGTIKKMPNKEQIIEYFLMSEATGFHKSNKVGDIVKYEDEAKSSSNMKLILGYLLNPLSNLLHTVLLSYIWFSISLIYYGVSLGITSVGNSNPYVVYLFSSLAETVGYMACHLNDRFSRKRVFFTFIAMASLMCLSVALIPVDKDVKVASVFPTKWNTILIMVFALFGKTMASASYNSAYMFTVQTFPTELRTTFLLFISGMGKIGKCFFFYLRKKAG